MATSYDDFWSKTAPGMLDLGMGLYNKRAAQSEAAGRLGAAQGPLYSQAMQGASGMLTQAGDMNPDTFATNRFNAGQAIVAPVQQKQLDDLMRTLRAKGQLGMATYNPGVEGITPNGTPMNPQLAAFYAAQNADQTKRAFASQQQGQDYIDNLLRRSGMLQGQAASTQNAGLAAQRTQPSRASTNAELLKGAAGILKDTGFVKQLPGMISSGADWLKTTARNFWNPTPAALVGDFGDDFDFGGGGFDFA